MAYKEEDADSQDFNVPMDHGHVARNCIMKIITYLIFSEFTSKSMSLLAFMKISVFFFSRL